MYLRMTGSELAEYLANAVETITGSATLYFRDVRYDKAEKVVYLPIERHGIQRERKWLGLRPHFRRSAAVKRRSMVVIRNVVECEVINNAPEYANKITILFGVVIKDKRISVGSVEEGVGDDRGLTWYVIHIKVEEMDLEIRDESEKGITVTE